MEKFYQKGVYAAPYKIIAMGDLHGDYRATILALLKGKIINKKLQWIAGKTHVVQLGDILDRQARSDSSSDEDSEFKILKLFVKLQKEAYVVGGAFHCVIGNHEFMNVQGDFGFTSKMGINHFKNGAIGRYNYFKPGGPIAKLFAKTWNVVIKIGKYIFVHGGMSLHISKKYSNNVQLINKLMRFYLHGNIKLLRLREFDELFLNKESLLWNRNYSSGFLSNKKYNELKKIMKNQHVSYIVVGHTPQKNGINLQGNLIWRIDTGMSRAFGKFNEHRIQLLEIKRNGKNVNVIT